jgi:hypothetical protein
LDVTGSVERSTHSKLSDVVSVKDFGAVGDGTTNDSAAFTAALAYTQTLTNGGEIYIPPGTYRMNMDMTDTTPNGEFFKKVTVRGAGRGVTTIRPASAGSIVLNLFGRNRCTFQDFTIKSGDVYEAACAIYIARRDLSGNPGNGNCNNNKFLNIEVSGNYSSHAVVSCGAESSLWFNCKFEPTDTSGAGFWLGSNPALCGVTPPNGTAVVGPGTDNRMRDCEFYMPFNNAKGIIASQAGGWIFDGIAFIFGTANSIRMVSIKDFDGGVFNGPLQFRNCHWEAFVAGAVINYGVWIEGSGIRYVYDLSITGGFYVVDANFVAIDYENRGVTEGAILYGGEFICPALASGYAGTAAVNIYINSMFQCLVWWKHRGSLARVNCIAASDETTFLGVDSLISAGNNSSIILTQQAAVTDAAALTSVNGTNSVAAPTKAEFDALVAEFNKLRTDVGVVRTAINACLARLRLTGIIDV